MLRVINRSQHQEFRDLFLYYILLDHHISHIQINNRFIDLYNFQKRFRIYISISKLLCEKGCRRLSNIQEFEKHLTLVNVISTFQCMIK